MKKSNVVMGVLAGVAVGALLGILFAPDKGTNTRKKIYRKGEVVVEDLQEKAHKLSEKASHLAAKASRLVDKVNESVSNVKSQAHDVVENAKSKFAGMKHES
jgi:gas vesicle protein